MGLLLSLISTEEVLALRYQFDVGPIFARQFKYEKTLDMSGAPDSSKIPNVDFNFEIGGISSDQYERYGIGGEYTSEFGELITVQAGTLPAETVPFSTVSFRETDVYDDVLTSMVDNYQLDIETGDMIDPVTNTPISYVATIFPYTIANHAIKYDWGRIDSSVAENVVTARPRTESDPAFPNSDWPADTVAIATDDDGATAYLNDTPIDEFDIRDYHWELTLATHHVLHSVNRPLITHQAVNEAGEYQSLSKTLFTPAEYEQALQSLTQYNASEYDTIYRFALRETASSDENIAVDPSDKILDLYNNKLYIFDTVEQADEFYQKQANYIDYVPNRSSAHDYVDPTLFEFSANLPAVSFNNAYTMYQNPEGSLKTTVEVNGIASKENEPAEVPAEKISEGIYVLDTVQYEGLPTGQSYSLTGELYEVNDGIINESAIASVTQDVVVSDTGNGSWTLDFGLVAELEAGKTYVVYETATSKENLLDSDGDNQPDTQHILKHHDATDKEQTFIVQKMSTPVEQTKEVQISKVDLAGKGLSGAKIQIIDATGEQVAEWVSGEDAKTLKLQPGEYVFREDSTPEGYIGVADIHFTVNEDGTITVTKHDKADDVKAVENQLVVVNKPSAEEKTEKSDDKNDRQKETSSSDKVKSEKDTKRSSSSKVTNATKKDQSPKAESKHTKRHLPQTGEKISIYMAIAGVIILVAGIGLFSYKKKQQ